MRNDTPIPLGLCQCGCGERTRIAEKNCTSNGDIKGRPRRYIVHHHRRKSPLEYVVEDRGYPDGPCWIWQRAISGTGYGNAWVGGRVVRAHIVVYQRHKGSIPPGLELDHLCRVRSCVNPDHLEPVTHIVNVLRGAGVGKRGPRKRN